MQKISFLFTFLSIINLIKYSLSQLSIKTPKELSDIFNSKLNKNINPLKKKTQIIL